jgi:hypothetical protein
MFMFGVNEDNFKCGGTGILVHTVRYTQGRCVYYLRFRGVPSGSSDAVQGLSKLFFEFSKVIPLKQGNIKIIIYRYCKDDSEAE